MITTPRQLLVELLANPSHELRQCIKEPHFEVKTEDGYPMMATTNGYAEVELNTTYETSLLSMPLTDRCREESLQRASSINRLNSQHLPGISLIRQGIFVGERGSNLRYLPLLLEHIPKGDSLETLLITGCYAESLVAALDRLELEFQRLRFSHNNLKPRNLILTQKGEFIAIRCYKAKFDGVSQSDQKAFLALRQAIIEADSPYSKATEPQNRDRLPFEIVGAESESLSLIKANGLFGYADHKLNVVIKPQFISAESFREGRAEVETKSGAGLINKRGEFVVPPIYDIVDYDDMEGIAHIKYGKAWAVVDYSGTRITDFSPKRIELINRNY